VRVRTKKGETNRWREHPKFSSVRLEFLQLREEAVYLLGQDAGGGGE